MKLLRQVFVVDCPVVSRSSAAGGLSPAQFLFYSLVTAGLTLLWGCNPAERLKWQFWLLWVQSDGLWGGTDDNPQDRHIGEDFLLKEDPHLGGKVEEGDQTKEAGYWKTEEEHPLCELEQNNDS